MQNEAPPVADGAKELEEKIGKEGRDDIGQAQLSALAAFDLFVGVLGELSVELAEGFV